MPSSEPRAAGDALVDGLGEVAPGVVAAIVPEGGQAERLQCE